MAKNKAKSRASNIKRKKIDKKNRARDNAFGFTKAKTIKEFEGFASQDSDEDLPQPSHTIQTEEEVIVVSNDQPKEKTFHQLSQLSVLDLVSTSDTVDLDDDLGFFIDTTPSVTPQKKLKDESIYIESDVDDPGFFFDATPSVAPQKKQRKILKDESIYIEGDDDDSVSISSSEDVDVLHALSHWGSQNDLQFDEPVRTHRRSDHDDFALLEATFYQDIFTEDMPDEEESAKKPPTVLDIILNDFIRQDHLQTYSLPHLSHHGRTMIVPILAKLFQLTTKEVHSKRHIKLEKTLSTCIPSSFIDYKHQLKKKKKTKVKLSPYEKKIKKQQDKKLFKENELHGKEVASNSAPIPASNKGHRMLSAMGWKEGDAIGKDGIKEPVKAFMRANRRGLGA